MTKFCLGECGYDLYAEIHKNYFNQLIHGLFMPFVVYGVLLGLPALFNQTRRSITVRTQIYIYILYLAYYTSFDLYGALMSAVIYSPVLYLVTKKVYVDYSRWQNIKVSLAWIFLAVGIQELFGHTLFEQINSDLWQLPNSIMISPLFGARCLFHSV